MSLRKFSITIKPEQINMFQELQNRQKPLGGGTLTCVPKILFRHNYDGIISLENLLGAWCEFAVGKRSRKDVQEFELNLMDNLFDLHRDLSNRTYTHSKYESFVITDPKFRLIHKATVRDRILHRALYRKFYPFFDKMFISDSFSCRNNKGTHKAINRFGELAFKVSHNHTRICWVLKCDIKQFFASIDHPKNQTLHSTIRSFLIFNLHLTLHPKKIFIKTIASGVDFLGWINFIDHRILRTATKRRMLHRIEAHPAIETFQSYFGLTSHGNTKLLSQKIAKMSQNPFFIY